MDSFIHWIHDFTFKVYWKMDFKQGNEWKTQWVILLGINLGLLDVFNTKGYILQMGCWLYEESTILPHMVRIYMRGIDVVCNALGIIFMYIK